VRQTFCSYSEWRVSFTSCFFTGWCFDPIVNVVIFFVSLLVDGSSFLVVQPHQMVAPLGIMGVLIKCPLKTLQHHNKKMVLRCSRGTFNWSLIMLLKKFHLDCMCFSLCFRVKYFLWLGMRELSWMPIFYC